jgi:hypothetical protein
LTTRQINTRVAEFPICDVCGRTVLRGEHVTSYTNGSARREVCELCETRALHEGWVREGSLDAFPSSSSTAERRRSIFSRRRGRRETATSHGAVSATWEEDSAASSWSQNTSAEPPPKRRQRRQVHAVPTDDGQRAVKAVELFNRSEHRRTVSGVARSLGRPAVNVSPVPGRPSLVSIVISWELCWYRYEVDLSDDGTSVRVAAQGYELDALDERERQPNAVADEFGQVTLERA